MNSLLVTGGCGFIGSNFIRLQRKLYPDLPIINLDSLTYAGNPENLVELEGDPLYTFVKGDVCDRECLNTLFSARPIGAVVHFAAESHVDRSILDSSPFIQTNIVGTQTLLDACRQQGVSRYLQVSTDEVYGSLGDDGVFTEQTPLDPSSPYSASKAAADLLVLAAVRTFSFPALITRCSNNYGPFQFPEKLIPLFVSNALQGQSVPVYGQGQNVRDWIHVDDHCRGIDAALRRGRLGEVYNLGGQCELTNLELTKRLLDAVNQPHSLIRYVADRPGHDHRYAIDCSKAQRELGWQPEIDFDRGLRETIDWYRTHPEWIERVKSGAYRDYYARQYSTRLQ